MKNKAKFISFITILLIMMLIIVACSTDTENSNNSDPRDIYCGTWHLNLGGGEQIKYIISLNKIIVQNPNSGYSYEVSPITWVPVNNTYSPFINEYPTGYKITGKISALSVNPGGNAGSISLNGNFGDDVSFFVSKDNNINLLVIYGNNEDWDNYIKE